MYAAVVAITFTNLFICVEISGWDEKYNKVGVIRIGAYVHVRMCNSDLPSPKILTWHLRLHTHLGRGVGVGESLCLNEGREEE